MLEYRDSFCARLSIGEKRRQGKGRRAGRDEAERVMKGKEGSRVGRDQQGWGGIKGREG